jgi:chromosome segregation ATPase
VTDVWEGEGGYIMKSNREEDLYHESAATLAQMVVELETTVEGLSQQNTELERDYQDQLTYTRVRADELLGEIDRHKTRYASAIRMIRSRQAALEAQRQAYQRLAEVFVTFRQEVDNCTEQVRDLRNVPLTTLDDAVDRVANRLSSAVDRI